MFDEFPQEKLQKTAKVDLRIIGQEKQKGNRRPSGILQEDEVSLIIFLTVFAVISPVWRAN